MVLIGLINCMDSMCLNVLNGVALGPNPNPSPSPGRIANTYQRWHGKNPYERWSGNRKSWCFWIANLRTFTLGPSCILPSTIIIMPIVIDQCDHLFLFSLAINYLYFLTVDSCPQASNVKRELSVAYKRPGVHLCDKQRKADSCQNTLNELIHTIQYTTTATQFQYASAPPCEACISTIVIVCFIITSTRMLFWCWGVRP